MSEKKFWFPERPSGGLKPSDHEKYKVQIKLLQEANQRISQDANNLAKALKGDSKIQGDWGELQLEILLEKSGLNPLLA